MNPRNDRNLRAVRSIERTGKTVEDAVREAMQMLRVSREEIDIEVLDEGRGGFLGLGAKEARIRARVRPAGGGPERSDRPSRAPAREESNRRPGRGPDTRGSDTRGSDTRGSDSRGPDSRSAGSGPSRADGPRHEAPTARPSGPREDRAPRDDRGPRRRGGRDQGERPERPAPAPRAAAPAPRVDGPRREPRAAASNGDLSDMLRDFAGGLLERIGISSQVTVEQQDGVYAVAVAPSGDESLLIGRGGETLDAIQHILLKTAARRQEGVQVRLDVGGYRDRRDDELGEKAKELAQEVLRTGDGITTAMLRASERRIVHRAVSEVPGVATRALGDGALKKILIEPEGGSTEISREVDLLGDGGAREEEGSRPPRSRPFDEERGGRGSSRGGRGQGGGRGGSRPRRSEEDDFVPAPSGDVSEAPIRAPRTAPAPPPAPREPRPAPQETPAAGDEWGRKAKPAKGRRR